MKKYLLLCFSLILLSSTAMAESSGYGLSFGFGEADPDIDIYRVGLKKDFSSKWFETKVGYFSGYFELSYNRWEYQKNEFNQNKNINGVAFSPVFAYFFGKDSNLIRPYIEGGIGVTYLDEKFIADRNMSTHFQFEDRFGAGVRIGFIDLNFRYMHYSNASIKGPNHGIDILMFTTAIQF
ncbi:MAG: acyloxyacyl hydrolase [Desulfobacteraceae bacterium]|nr:acyloxyacyl hydrolase [Desulfobacteraceae bacterium]